MFKFSGKVTLGQWWRAIAIIFPLWLASSFILQVAVNTMKGAMRYGETNNLAVFIFFISVIFTLAIYICGMGFTTRRLRDANYSSGAIALYVILAILLPVSLLVYLFLAGCTPSRRSEEEKQAESLQKREKGLKQREEYVRAAEEKERKRQAENWVKGEKEAEQYSPSPDEQKAYKAQAEQWAQEEYAKEQKHAKTLLIGKG